MECMAGRFNPTFQVYAAQGYAVLYLNPRGSSGYGQKFSDGTLNEWGGGDYKDLMAGVDEALRKYSWIDRGPNGRYRRIVWRLHDQLDHYADAAIQSCRCQQRASAI